MASLGVLTAVCCLLDTVIVGIPSSHERRGLLAEPLFERRMRLELGHLDAVDGRFRFPDLADFFCRHLADPKQAMPLETCVRERDGPFLERLVQVAAFNEHQVFAALLPCSDRHQLAHSGRAAMAL